MFIDNFVAIDDIDDAIQITQTFTTDISLCRIDVALSHKSYHAFFRYPHMILHGNQMEKQSL